MTVPHGPNFTPSRSRSTSVRNSPRCCMTPEETESPRVSSVAWSQSLRGRPVELNRSRREEASVDCTPERRKKRRSLSHWWSENEPDRRRSESTPNIRTFISAMPADGDDEISVCSVEFQSPGKKLAAELNSMSRRSKRKSVERKRQELDELVDDRSVPPIASLGNVCSGSQGWLRSLRQGGSCPPSLQAAHEKPKVGTGRVSSRSRQHSAEPPCMTPREQAALEKHLQRTTARSRSSSAQRSASATPERVAPASITSSRREPLQPVEIVTNATQERVARQFAVPLDHEKPQEPSRSRACSLMQARGGAPQTHSHDLAAAECTAMPEGESPITQEAAAAQETMSPSPLKRPVASAAQETKSASRGALVSVRERTAIAKHLERRTATVSKASGVRRRWGRIKESTESHDSQTGCPPPGASTAHISRVVLDTVAAGADGNAEEEWAGKATNPQERAERCRDMAKSKFDQVFAAKVAHEKSRVCIFKRTGAALGGSPRVTTHTD